MGECDKNDWNVDNLGDKFPITAWSQDGTNPDNVCIRRTTKKAEYRDENDTLWNIYDDNYAKASNAVRYNGIKGLRTERDERHYCLAITDMSNAKNALTGDASNNRFSECNIETLHQLSDALPMTKPFMKLVREDIKN